MAFPQSCGLQIASDQQKSATKHIVISEPDEQQLRLSIEGRELAPGLITFLKRLLKASRWTRIINIPSGRNDLAAVIVFTSTLKAGGLEIVSELHVFLAGRTIVEKWQIAGENEQKSFLAQRVFSAVDIQKVRVEGTVVTVELSAPTRVGSRETRIRSFDFGSETQPIRVIPNPFL